jgi:hypothetical protein
MTHLPRRGSHPHLRRAHVTAFHGFELNQLNYGHLVRTTSSFINPPNDVATRGYIRSMGPVNKLGCRSAPRWLM